jgi:hypothetical protein
MPIIRPINIPMHSRNRLTIPRIRRHDSNIRRTRLPHRRSIRRLAQPSNIPFVVLIVDDNLMFVGRRSIREILRKVLPDLCDPGAVPGAGVGVVRGVETSADLELVT